MFNLQFFNTLTKPKPILRNIRNADEDTLSPTTITIPVDNSKIAKRPAWIKLNRLPGNNIFTGMMTHQQERDCIWKGIMTRNIKERIYNIILNSIPGCEKILLSSTLLRWYATFTFKLWKPRGLPAAKLPFKLNSYVGLTPVLRTSYKEYSKVGLASILEKSSRIKSIGLEGALLFSYYRDIRYALVFSLTIGIFIWVVGTNSNFLAVPQAIYLTSEPEALTRIVNDTYIHNICSSHHTPSPCTHCNEPLNSVVRELIPDLPEESKKTAMLKGLSTLIGTVFLTLMLNESISAHGVNFPLSY